MSVVDQMMQHRYAHSAGAVAFLKAAGAKAAERLLEMIASDQFHEYPLEARLKVIDMALKQAYGAPESASSYALAMMKGREKEPAANSQASLAASLDKLEGFKAPEVIPNKRVSRTIQYHSDGHKQNVIRLDRSDVPMYTAEVDDDAA